MKNPPLALYVHWPFCKAKCPYCDFNSHVRESVEQARWKNALLAELGYFAEKMPGRELESIFFGGGTPSLMPPDTAAAIIAAARSYWPSSDVEITLEANPTSVEAGKFQEFRSGGINRVSLGVQALNQQDLQFLGRQHDVNEALHAVRLAQEIFPRSSFDLIYARPGQTVDGWEEELQEAIAHADGHLSLYQLTIEQGTKFYQAYHHQKAFALPDEETSAALYQRTQEIMEAHGLPAYEISNHARPGQESRHNIAYWKSHEYIGIGPGAHGRLDLAGTRTSTVTHRSPEKWLEETEKHGHGVEAVTPLSPQERREEYIMMGMRLREGIPLAELSAKSINIPASTLAHLKKEGVLENSADYLRATPRGRLVLNALTAELLRS